MIVFLCKYCVETIEVPDRLAGKKIKCPKCGDVVRVPDKPDSARSHGIQKKDDAALDPKYSSDDLTLLDVSGPLETQKQADQPGDGVQTSAETVEVDDFQEIAAKRKIPWPLDIFLYPLSKTGIIILSGIILVRWLFKIMILALAPLAESILIWKIPFMLIFSIGIFVRIVLYLYLFWYLCECVRDSAEGGIRAPDTSSITPGMGELLVLLFRVFVLLVVMILPAAFYSYKVGQDDIIFWLLLIYPAIFLPMGFLAVAMFDSIYALNPVLLVKSIFSVFLPYCGVVLVTIGIGFLIITCVTRTAFTLLQVFVIYCVTLYLLVVAAHLLGCFYRRYSKKLEWDI